MPTPELPLLFAGKRRRILPLLCGVGMAQAFLSVGLTLTLASAAENLLAEAADTGNAAGARSGVLLALAGLAGLALVTLGLRAVERSVSESLGQSYVHRLRLAMWDHLCLLPARSVTGNRRGALILRFVGDLGAIKNWVSRGIVGGVVGMATLAGALAALAYLDWRIAAVTTLCLAAIAGLQLALSSSLSDRVRLARRLRGRLATDIVERIDALTLIQSNDQGRRERRRLRRRSKKLGGAVVASARTSGLLSGLADSGAIFMIVGVMAMALGPASDARAGVIVAALVLARYLGAPVRRLTRVHELWLRARVARSKIGQFLDLERQSEPDAPKRLKRGGGALKLDAVCATPGSRPVSARVPVGARVHVVGANGSGKSSLLRVLAGLERPSSGRLVLDGRDLSRTRLRSFRRAIGYVDSTPQLLRGSVRKNLTYRSAQTPDEEIDAVLDVIDPDSRIASLPNGLDETINENGANLPAGIAQRVVLARALIGNPRLLVLDEPQLHLDSEGLGNLRELIATYPGTVVFAWNGADAPAADFTWDLDHGETRFERPTLVLEGASTSSSDSSALRDDCPRPQTAPLTLVEEMGAGTVATKKEATHA